MLYGLLTHIRHSTTEIFPIFHALCSCTMFTHYVRLFGCRSEPAGTVYAILDAPPALSTTSSSTTSTGGDGDGDGDKDGDYDPSHKEGGKGGNDGDDDDDDEEAKEMDPLHIGYTYNPGLPSTADALGSTLGGNIKYLMTSTDYGSNWTWAPLPSDLQAGGQASIDILIKWVI